LGVQRAEVAGEDEPALVDQAVAVVVDAVVDLAGGELELEARGSVPGDALPAPSTPVGC
jgi:hypothetical protein